MYYSTIFPKHKSAKLFSPFQAALSPIYIRLLSTMISSHLPAALLAFALLVSADSECYWRNHNVISPEAPSGWFACNNTNLTPDGAQLCCLNGGQCSNNQLCRVGLTNGSVGYSYYVGGCTDPNYSDPVCRMDCSESSAFARLSYCLQYHYRANDTKASDYQTYVQWDLSVSAWRCCGDSGCTTGTPTSETFQADSPQQFVAVPSALTTMSSSIGASTATLISSVSLTSSITTSPTAEPNIGLSTGAKAGIGVGAAIGGLVVAGAIFFLCWRKGKSNSGQDPSSNPEARRQEREQDTGPPQIQQQNYQGSPAYCQQSPSQLAYNVARKEAPMSPQEMSGDARAELSADDEARK